MESKTQTIMCDVGTMRTQLQALALEFGLHMPSVVFCLDQVQRLENAGSSSSSSSCPRVTAPRASLLGSTREYILCDYEACGASGARLRCSRCKLHRYCNRACQKAAWAAHKTLCNAISRKVKADGEKAESILAEEENKRAPRKSAPGDDVTCAICLEKPTDRVKLSCNHHFCYNCVGELTAHAITSGTVPNPVGGKMPCLPCPLCRAPTLSLDMTECFLAEASTYLERVNILVQSPLANRAKAVIADLRTKAALVLDTALRIMKHEPGGEEGDASSSAAAASGPASGLVRASTVTEPLYPNIMFKRAELAADMGDFALGAELMAMSTEMFKPGRQADMFRMQPGGRRNIYNHIQLHGRCLVKGGHPAEAIAVLKQGQKMMLGWSEVGATPKIDRDFYEDYVLCLHQLGRHEQAVEMGTGTYLCMNRSYAQAHKVIALSQRALGNIDEAITTMRKAVCYETPWDPLNLERNKELLRQLLDEKESCVDS